jgi:Stage II sporulation protein
MNRFATIAVLAVVASACAPDEPGQQSEHLESQAPSVVFTQEDGWLDIEEDYLARVCTQENGKAAYAALETQVIAARTYLLRAMRDDPALGSEAKPVVNGESFQAYAASANPGCAQAAAATRGLVGVFQGELIVANYVAGALVRFDGSIGKDPTHTEKFITYNEGKSGDDVTPAPKPIALPSRPDNRGCMGQNRADYLATSGYDTLAILHYFYGADLELTTLGQDAGPAVGDPCGTILERGACHDEVLFWCSDGAVTSFDCSLVGRSCVEEEIGPSCQEPETPAPTCGEVTYEGDCNGDVLSWCTDYGLLEIRDCAAEGLTCGDNPGFGGLDCLPAVSQDCSGQDSGVQCVDDFLVRCSGEQLSYLDCGTVGMICSEDGDFPDCAAP